MHRDIQSNPIADMIIIIKLNCETSDDSHPYLPYSFLKNYHFIHGRLQMEALPSS